MKNVLKLFLITLLIVMFSTLIHCSKLDPEIEYEKLQKRGDEVFYVVNEEKPFTGKAVSYFDNGQKEAEIMIKKGIINGVTTKWFYNGQKREEIEYQDGVMSGLHKTWFDNGQIESEENYKNDIIHGNSVYWYENGQKMKEGAYENGEMVAYWNYWTKEGKTIEEIVKDDVLPAIKLIFEKNEQFYKDEGYYAWGIHQLWMPGIKNDCIKYSLTDTTVSAMIDNKNFKTKATIIYNFKNNQWRLENADFVIYNNWLPSNIEDIPRKINKNFTRQTLVDEVNKYASSIIEYYKVPPSHGGGGGSFERNEYLATWIGFNKVGTYTNENGSYHLRIINKSSVEIIAIGIKKGNDGINPIKISATITPNSDNPISLSTEN